jgi:hypothetical protein
MGEESSRHLRSCTEGARARLRRTALGVLLGRAGPLLLGRAGPLRGTGRVPLGKADQLASACTAAVHFKKKEAIRVIRVIRVIRAIRISRVVRVTG